MTLASDLADDFATALRARPASPNNRKRVMRDQLRAAAIPAYASDLHLRKGRCFRCKASRRSVVRVTFDYTSARAIEPFAHVECATCGHVWYRVAVPRLGQYQSVRLTLILPGDQRRWYARGRWHTDGQDAITIREATWSDLMDAGADWRKRNTRYEAAKARAKQRKADAEAAALAKSRALLEYLHQQDAERAAAEREAQAREAAA